MSTGRRSRSALALLFVGIFALWWGISVISQNTATVPVVSSQNLPVNNNDSSVPYTGGPVSVTVSTTQGVVSYQGDIILPTSCDTLGSGIAEQGANPAHVSILLTLSSTNGCVAASATTSASFDVSLAESQSQKPVFDGLTINGVIEPATLVEQP